MKSFSRKPRFPLEVQCSRGENQNKTPTKKTSSLRKLSATTTARAPSAVASHAALTTTFVGGAARTATGDTTNGVAPFTLTDDMVGGDLCNGGDTFTYLYEANQRSNSFTASVRVIDGTEEATGRWGKAGIQARSTLDPGAANGMAQIAVGTGSQVLAPSVGAHNPVPVRLGGRTQNDGNGGFENQVLDAGAAEVPTNVFPEGGSVNTSWLSLSWDANTNEFVAGIAPDDDGAPGTWSHSAPVSDIPSDGDWYVGVGYSAHNDSALAGGESQHGVTFDNFSIIPEPSSLLLPGVSALGFLTLRRRR